MKNVIDVIREDNPSYDPINAARIKIGMSENWLKASIDRVYTDGYYGPISADDWAEQDGRQPYSVSNALDSLQRVADNVEDYWDNEDDEFGFDFNNRVDARDIVKAEWGFLVDIYGDLPF